MAAYSYQPPLVPSKEGQVAPSIQLHLKRAHRVWRETRATLLRAAERNQQIAAHQRHPAPDYRPGHEVRLSTRD